MWGFWAVISGTGRGTVPAVAEFGGMDVESGEWLIGPRQRPLFKIDTIWMRFNHRLIWAQYFGDKQSSSGEVQHRELMAASASDCVTELQLTYPCVLLRNPSDWRIVSKNKYIIPPNSVSWGRAGLDTIGSRRRTMQKEFYHTRFKFGFLFIEQRSECGCIHHNTKYRISKCSPDNIVISMVPYDCGHLDYLRCYLVVHYVISHEHSSTGFLKNSGNKGAIYWSNDASLKLFSNPLASINKYPCDDRWIAPRYPQSQDLSFHALKLHRRRSCSGPRWILQALHQPVIYREDAKEPKTNAGFKGMNDIVRIQDVNADATRKFKSVVAKRPPVMLSVKIANLHQNLFVNS